jgi:flagellar assembly protein FliH
MATVIRSAQISSEQVMLPTRGRAAAQAQVNDDGPVRAKAEPVVVPKQPLARIEPIVQSSVTEQPHQPVEDPAATLYAELAQREKRLSERERLFQDEQDAERHRVSEEAYKEGFERGEADAVGLHRDRLDALDKLIESLKKEFAGEITGLEDVIVSIAFEAVCKIVGEAMYDTDGVLAVVRMVMGKVKDQEKLVLHVSPLDYNLLYQNREKLFAEGQGIKHELVSDDRVALGGCLIETAGGTIDGRLEIQMQQLRETLIGVRKMIPEQS